MTIPFVQLLGPSASHRRDLGEKINMLLRGYHNEVHDVKMTINAWTTRYPAGTDTLERITPATVPVLIPKTVNAASLQSGAAAHTAPLYGVPNVGYITFNHCLVGNDDQYFWLLLFGD